MLPIVSNDYIERALRHVTPKPPSKISYTLNDIVATSNIADDEKTVILSLGLLIMFVVKSLQFITAK